MTFIDFASSSWFFLNFLWPSWGSFWKAGVEEEGSLTHFAMQRRKSKSNFDLKSEG